jgi:beta-galactosidase
MDEGGTSNATKLRYSYGLNRGWEYREGRATGSWFRNPPDSGSATTSLPHTWNRHDTFQVGVEYRRGYGSYRRQLRVPHPAGAPSDTRWFICSEGFYGTGEIFLGGRELAKIDGQFLGFEVDATESLATADSHALGIRLTNACSRDVLPGIKMPDFVLHGGLAGRCRLVGLPPLRLLQEESWVRIREIVSNPARIDLLCAAVNQTDSPRKVRARWRIVAPSGGRILEFESEAVEVAPGARNPIDISGVTLDDPVLWHIASPELYTIEVELVEEGVVDCVSFKTGIRTAEFSRDGFFLNGSRLMLRGCNRHESIPGIGSAMTPGLHRLDAELVHEFGCNFVRLSHYPQHPSFLNACDELGILVYAEIATWKSVRGGGWLRNARKQMRDMVRRDRHHPSVILWGMGNESRHRKAYVELGEICRESDDTRPTVYAENHLYRGRRHDTLGIPDVLGLNYEIERIEEGERESKRGSVVISECSSYPTPRGDIEAQVAQVEMLVRDLSTMEKRPCLAGYAVWCYNDYATLRKKRYVRHSGIVDAWRMPKLSAYLMQALTGDCPCLVIAGDWSEITGKTARELHIVSNCGEISLNTAGETRTTLTADPYAVCRIDFSGETLVAEGKWNQQPVQFQLEPWSRATAMHALNPRPRWDLDETAWIDIHAVDARGRRVLDYNGEVLVNVEGPAQALCHRPDNVVPVDLGLGRVFILSSGEPGDVVVTISSGPLAGARVTVSFEKTDSGPIELR